MDTNRTERRRVTGRPRAAAVALVWSAIVAGAAALSGCGLDALIIQKASNEGHVVVPEAQDSVLVVQTDPGYFGAEDACAGGTTVSVFQASGAAEETASVVSPTEENPFYAVHFPGTADYGALVVAVQQGGQMGLAIAPGMPKQDSVLAPEKWYVFGAAEEGKTISLDLPAMNPVGLRSTAITLALSQRAADLGLTLAGLPKSTLVQAVADTDALLDDSEYLTLVAQLLTAGKQACGAGAPFGFLPEDVVAGGSPQRLVLNDAFAAAAAAAPGFCPAGGTAACGHDGVTYANECAAAAAGVPMLRAGACEDEGRVCGCDGQTYDPASAAVEAGVRISTVGACREGTPAAPVCEAPPVELADWVSAAFEEDRRAVSAQIAFKFNYATDRMKVVWQVDFNPGLTRNCGLTNITKWLDEGALNDPNRQMFITGGVHIDTPICGAGRTTHCLTPEQQAAINLALGNDATGGWQPNVTRMWDDGQNGDTLAGDNIWTFVLEVPYWDPAEAPDGAGLRLNYKATWGRAKSVWTGTEEWPGNSRLLEIVDLNGDHLVVRRDLFGDETTNKDKQNLLQPARGGCGVVVFEAQKEANPDYADCVMDSREALIDTDGDCVLDTWPTAPTVLPAVEDEAPPPADGGEAPAGE